MEWKLKGLGNADGFYGEEGKEIRIQTGESRPADPEGLRLFCRGGKLSDSEDSFLCLYTVLDPARENFTLAASFETFPFSPEETPDYQSGFGLVAFDTDFSEDKGCRHRNSLLVGRFGRERRAGMRAVAGYESPEAKEFGPVRRLDQSRLFREEASGFPQGKSERFLLRKTDEGFEAEFSGEKLTLRGSDFLTKQSEKLFIGFAAARKLGIRVTEVSFETVPGKLAPTPAEEIRYHVPDYPFPRELWEELYRGASPERNEEIRGEAMVSPAGRPEASGTAEDPLDLESAWRRARAGATLLLEDGLYPLARPLIARTEQSGDPDAPVKVRAKNRGKAILSGAGLSSDFPLAVLAGNFWRLEGLVFEKSPLSGLMIAGNGNRVEACEARENGDTGILILSCPGAEKNEWPSDNAVVSCESHHNVDPVFSNADGFGAKLRVGRGNRFLSCVAHHNADDGFDLYAKAIWGPTGAVELDRCVAFENGRARDKAGSGTGFKLGGENQPAAHEVWNCYAFENGRAGFSSNSNPSCRLYRCGAFHNGRGEYDDFVFSTQRESDWVRLELRHEIPEAILRVRTTRRLPDEEKSAKKKRVMVLISTLYGGGAERVACRLASALAARNRVWILYYDRKKGTYALDPRVKKLDISHRERPALKNPVLRRMRFRLTVVRRIFWISVLRLLYRIDATVSLLERPNVYNVRALGGGRRITSERNDPAYKSEEYRRHGLYAFSRSDLTVFQSERVRSSFPAAIREKSCVIHNPVEVTCAASEKKEKKIVAVGRFMPQKNHAMLIRAFAAFHRTHPGYTLCFYGEGMMEEEMRSLVAACGLCGAVRIEGFSDDVHREIRDAEMFVLSSDYEGLSNALMEAMMMGLAVISTDCAGSEELLEDGVNGLVIPRGDEGALLRAMERLAGDPELRESVARRAAASAVKYRPDEIIRKWERIL